MINSFSGKIEIPSEKEITDTLNFIEKKTNDYSSYSKEMDKGIIIVTGKQIGRAHV